MTSNSSSSGALQPDQVERVDAFATAAEAYCRWVEGDARDPVQDAAMARALTAELFRRAVDLPHMFESDLDAPDIGADDYQRIYRRLGSLPFNYYSECFNPLVVPAEEPVTADLADDLADIWRDVKSGLLVYRTGKRAAAGWQWRFHFEAHWGHHAAAAMYALQSWFSVNTDTINQLPT